MNNMIVSCIFLEKILKIIIITFILASRISWLRYARLVFSWTKSSCLSSFRFSFSISSTNFWASGKNIINKTLFYNWKWIKCVKNWLCEEFLNHQALKVNLNVKDFQRYPYSIIYEWPCHLAVRLQNSFRTQCFAKGPSLEGKKNENYPLSDFLQNFEFSRAFSPVLHGEKSGKLHTL